MCSSDLSMGLADRLEHALGPWVNFIIMPVFALANAGVEISDLSYFNIFHFTPDLGSVGMGIFLGLVIGKPLGITLSSLIAIKCWQQQDPKHHHPHQPSLLHTHHMAYLQ